jgi:subtilisin-like proprotein convertase family protein
MRIRYGSVLTLAAGAAVMATGVLSLHAAVTQMSTDVPKPITDLATVTSTLNFTEIGITIDVDVATLNITHTWEGDVEISLSRPGGALVLIMGDCGGSDDNWTNVFFSDEGVIPNCVADAAPHSGPLRGAPNGIPSLSVMTNFDGVSSGGVWTLSLFDDFSGDTGTLTAWGVAADGPPPLPVELMRLEVD